MPDPAVLIETPSDQLLAANRMAYHLLGKPDKLEKASFCKRFFSHQLPKFLVFTEEVLYRGAAWSRDFSVANKQGKMIALELSASRIADNRLLLVMRDLQLLSGRRVHHEAEHTQRGGLLEWRRVEALFRDMERENQLILHAVGEGIYGVDAKGVITFVNPAAERMLGWRSEDLIGRVMHRVVHHSHEDGSRYPLLDCPIYAAFRDATVHRVGEDWFWHRNGSGFPVEYTSTPIVDDGRPVGAVVVFRDISLRVQAERQLRQALAEVESLKQRLELENAYLQETLSAEHYFHEIVGCSEAVQQLMRRIGLVAPTDANVLITGESGTGKELIARAIHQASNRRDRPLIRVNCAAIPKDLFESEFFGHMKGAFTGAFHDRVGRFELADGGTLFLDEVGEIPLELQGKLLRVLQEQQFERVGDNRTRTVNVRVIAATNKDLKAEVQARGFREDLYFRLNVFPIESVPLRQRTADIPLLAQEFLKRTCQKLNRPVIPLRRGDVAVLQAYHWPGNVRELENIIERQVIVATHNQLRFDLPDARTGLATLNSTLLQQPAIANNNKPGEMPLNETRQRQLMQQNLIAALKQAAGRVSGSAGAAEILGIKPTTLASRLKVLKINPRDFR